MDNTVSALRTLSLVQVENARIVTPGIRRNERATTGLVMDPNGVEPLPILYWRTFEEAEEVFYMTDYGKQSAKNFANPSVHRMEVAQPIHTEYRMVTPYRMGLATSLRLKWETCGYESRGAYRTYTTVDGIERFQINLFCIPLMRIPGFFENLREYQEHPDEGIQVSDGSYILGDLKNRAVTEDDIQNVLDYNEEHPEKPQRIPTLGALMDFRERRFLNDIDNQWDKAIHDVEVPADALMKTGNEWEYTAFLNVYSFTKMASGDTEVTRNSRYKANLARRLNALKALKSDRDLNVDDFINTKITLTHLMRHFDDMSYYPRLKCTILKTLMNSQDPLCANLKMLLSEHQMTVFCAIAAFIATKELSVLHILHEVSCHYGQFVRTIEGLKKKFGTEGWRYVKLLDPLNQVTSGQIYAELGTAARAWIAVQPGHESFGNLVNKGKIPARYKIYASRPVPPDCLEEGVNMMNVVRDNLERIGFTIKLEQFTQAKWAELVVTTAEQRAAVGNRV
ncbi:hypothetical protein [Culex mononega-like virus 2]|uniref:Uncharacterized protein n=1 Tax=Culex mononega-like virus 2 TaxID=2010272 RepID=A0A1Z2RSY8_9MONO|nr:hypothetical protein QKB88_gp1 [Culex mononega-like virus 2]ASA47317.1 hypothetical protein [Culex mononega-like virus 2]